MARAHTRTGLWKATAYLLVAVVLALAALQAYRAGRLAASVAVCVLALGVCSYVVYLSYPHVVQWARERRLRIPWGYRLTREGVFYSLVVIVVGAAAAFSGNNLLYLVFSCLLAAMLLAGFVSRLVLSGLQLDIRMPDHIFAQQPVLLRITLQNLKRWIPSFSIWISTAPASGSAQHQSVRSRRGFGRRGRARRRSGPLSSLVMAPIYCPMVTGGGFLAAAAEATFPIRGRFQNEVFWLRTKFPFSFVERRARLHPAHEMTVYPPVEPSPRTEEIVNRLAAEHTAHLRGDSHDLYRIRPAAPEDGARLVDWKATARSRELLVKEFTRDDHLRVEIVFDTTPAEGESGEQRFEQAVQECAAVLWRLRELRAEIQFISPDVSISTAANSAAVFQILRYLSTVEPLDRRASSTRLSAAGSAPRPDPLRLVFGASSVHPSPALQSSKA